MWCFKSQRRDKHVTQALGQLACSVGVQYVPTRFTHRSFFIFGTVEQVELSPPFCLSPLQNHIPVRNVAPPQSLHQIITIYNNSRGDKSSNLSLSQNSCLPRGDSSIYSTVLSSAQESYPIINSTVFDGTTNELLLACANVRTPTQHMRTQTHQFLVQVILQ